jgi:hypothetical protein
MSDLRPARILELSLSKWQRRQPVDTHTQPIRGRRPWLGAALIAVGALYLLSNTTGVHVGRAWAALLIVPALGAFVRAWPGLTAEGAPDRTAMQTALGGVALLVVAATALLDLSWNIAWPILVVLTGAVLLLRPDRRTE